MPQFKDLRRGDIAEVDLAYSYHEITSEGYLRTVRSQTVRLLEDPHPCQDPRCQALIAHAIDLTTHQTTVVHRHPDRKAVLIEGAARNDH